MKHKPSMMIAALGLLSTLAGQGYGQEAPPSPPAGEAKSGEQPPPPAFTYDAKGKRDPFLPNPEMFKPESQACSEDCDTPKVVRKPEPLEMFTLESLKFVGILLFAGETTAIIEDPTGHAYSVKTGNYMGTNEGKVMEIGTAHLSILEKAPTPSNKTATRTVILKLHRDEEEK